MVDDRIPVKYELAKKRGDRLIEKIETIINDAMSRFNLWVTTYAPWQGDNHTTERNLSFQFATAFLKTYPSGLVFMEVPFGKRKHLDGYLHTDEFDLLLECKNIYAPSHVQSIVADIQRMNLNLVKDVHSRHKVKPNKTHGIILAETWYPHVAEWWENNEKSTRNRWKDLRLPVGWEYRAKTIYQNKEKPKETLFWLYGVSGQLQ